MTMRQKTVATGGLIDVHRHPKPREAESWLETSSECVVPRDHSGTRGRIGCSMLLDFWPLAKSHRRLDGDLSASRFGVVVDRWHLAEHGRVEVAPPGVTTDSSLRGFPKISGPIAEDRLKIRLERAEQSPHRRGRAGYLRGPGIERKGSTLSTDWRA